jgi:hypothetical protein
MFLKSSIVLALFATTSCATVINGRYTNVVIHTTEPSKIIINQDTLTTTKNEVALALQRKKENVPFAAIVDGKTTDGYVLEPRNSAAFYGNLYYGALGVAGMAIDWKNPKRFTYRKHVYLNSADTIPIFYNNDQSDKKGRIFLNFSIPYVNMIRLKPIGEPSKNNTGFWGISVGADYYYRSSTFANLTVGAATDFYLPVIGAVSDSGERELMTSVYVSASNNHRLDRLSLGYGLTFARNGWNYSPDLDEPERYRRSAVSKYSNAAGLLATASLRLGRKFHIGLNYKPYLIRFSRTNTFDYQHVINFELLWKFRL